jgi:hypothetical protein
MEANKVGALLPEREHDPEALAYAMDVEGAMPEGEGPTVLELQADYLLEKLAEESAAMAHLNDFTERRIQMIRDHAEIEGNKIRGRVEWLEARLRRCVPYDPAGFQEAYGKKSLRLPHGTLGYRSSKESVQIADKDKALEFARSHGIEIKVTESVNKTPLLDYVRTTGDMPDPEVCGFELVPPTDDFFVKAGA